MQCLEKKNTHTSSFIVDCGNAWFKFKSNFEGLRTVVFLLAYCFKFCSKGRCGVIIMSLLWASLRERGWEESGDNRRPV